MNPSRAALTPQQPTEPHPPSTTARDGMCIVQPDWRIRYANASMLQVLQLIGHDREVERVWDLLPPTGRRADLLRRSMDERVPVTFRVPSPGGDHVLQFDAEPQPGGELRLRCRNVTSQARIEELEGRWREATLSLAEREARLDAVLAGAPVGMVLLDATSMTVVEANRASHEMLEGRWRTPGSTVGHAFADFIPGWAESGLEALLLRVRDSGEPYREEEREFGGFGATRWFRWSVEPVRQGGAGPVRFLLLVMVEMTAELEARRTLEAERRALYDVMDSLPVGVMVAEAPGGRTEYINPAGAALAGRPPDELVAGTVAEHMERWRMHRPTGEPYPPEELPMTRALNGESVRDLEVLLRPVDGPERTVLASGIPLRDGAGQVTRAVVSFYDVTDRLRLEEALLVRTAEAESAAGEAALRAEESRAMREMGRALVSVLEPAHVLRRAAEHAMELLGARGSFVATPATGDALALAPALGVLAPHDGDRLRLHGSIAQEVMASGAPRVYNAAADVPADAVGMEIVRRQHLRNLLFVPMQAFGQALGVLGAVDREGGFGDEEVRLLQAL
ncbi:MAG TPA: PAS domain-containing protein, partial [Longimicrobiaceae bacterium]|nr:PAS domain-containing protein [Longimicrobiaceae bacterium]